MSKNYVANNPCHIGCISLQTISDFRETSLMNEYITQIKCGKICKSFRFQFQSHQCASAFVSHGSKTSFRSFQVRHRRRFSTRSSSSFHLRIICAISALRQDHSSFRNHSWENIKNPAVWVLTCQDGRQKVVSSWSTQFTNDLDLSLQHCLCMVGP